MRKILTVIGFLLLSFSIAACTGATSITISFETNGGNTIEDMVVDTQDTSFELPTPVKEGFIFDGWYINEELTDPFNFATLLTATEITVYAKWSSGSVDYTMTFETNGGSAVAAITLASGATVTAPAAPTKTGFTFGGWYSDSALTTAYTFTVMPAENITLYAKWNAVVVQSTISFETNGGGIVPPITQNSGTAVVAPTPPTKTGYTFGGWYSDSALTTAYTFNLMPATNLVLYAKWNINSYQLQYLDNDGTVLQETNFEYGASLSGVIAPIATKEGYSFVGWNQDLPLTMPAQDLMVTARYVINQYTITFEEDGGSLVADIVLDYLADVTAPIAPTKAGYTFAGWYSDALLTTSYTFTTMPLNGLTLYAKWTATPYTISFEENGGSNVPDITQGYLTSVSTPASPTKAGYTFAGWYSDALLTTTYTFTTMPMNNLTVYAKWTINQYTISFEENGGDALPELIQDYLTEVSAPTPTKEAATFVGWYSDALLTIPYVFTTMPAANITVYAKWEATLYVITFFDFINGYYAMPAIEAAAGQVISIPTPEDIVGYDFMGWFTDVQFDVPYIETIMPAHDFTLYGLWEVSVYTVSYDTNEGSLIADADFTYFSEVPNPDAPTRAGYIFAGWFSDEALLVPFDFKNAPLADLTIYAKWIVDEGFDPIQLILALQPIEEVTLRGVIYYKFPDAMNPGFYLYDGTGYIFVLSSATGFSVGDGVEVVGYLGFFENTPQIENVTSISPDGTFTTMPNAVEMSLEDLIGTSEYDINIYGQLIELTAVVGQDGPNFYLTTLAADGIAVINFKSYLPMSNPFVSLVGQKVTIRAIVYDFNSHTFEWHILYDSGQSIVPISLTDQEKLDELVLFVQTMIDHQEFYNGQTMMIPTVEPVYGATISAVTFGVNASFYDPITGLFGTTTETIEIGLTLTISLGMLSESVDVTIVLKVIDSLTVAEFIAAEEMSYHQVTGVVIFTATTNDMQMMVVADSTGTLAVVSNSEVAVGDYVIVAGYRMSQDGMAMMANQDPSMSLITIIEHDHLIPIDPIVITVEEFQGLNADIPLYWLQYFEVTGRLAYDDMLRSFVIEDGLNQLPIFAFDQDTMDLLSGYEGFIVSVRGISLPSFDIEQQSLLFVYSGRVEDIILDYTDEELVTELSTLLADYLSYPTYYPGQFVELPTDHPSISMNIAYEAFGVNAGLIDLTTGEISSTIESEVWIDLHVTITIGLVSQTFDIQLHVAPISILTVSQFYALADYDNPYFVTGTVIFIQTDESIYMLADESHVIFVMTMTPLAIGDIVVAFGYKMHDGGMIMLVGDSMDTIVDLSSHDNSNPLIKTLISISDFILTDISLPENLFKYFQMTGTLTENPEFHIFFLSDGENMVPIFPVSPEAYQALIAFSGMEVFISGLAMPNPENPESASMLVFINYPGDVIPNMTPEEFASFIADSTVTKHLISIFRPGTTYLLKDDYPTFNLTIVYQTTGTNAGLYDVATGLISADITEELYIDINATSYLDGVLFATYSFQIHVVPEAILTVTEFYNLLDTDNPYKVEGTVIYTQPEQGLILVADAHNIIMVMTDAYADVGDYVLVQGTKMNAGGMITLVGDPTTTLVEIISSNNSMPLIPLTISYADFLALDPYDGSNNMKYYEFIGTLTEDVISHIFYISDGVNSIPMMTPKFQDYQFLLSYVNTEIKLKAITSSSGDAGQMMLVFINYPGDVGPAYTPEEYVDVLASTLPGYYAAMTFIPGQTYLFPSEDLGHDITFSYQLLGPNAALYDLVTGLISDTILFEEVIEVTVTITGGMYSQDVVVVMNIVLPTIVTIQQFIEGTPGVLYQIQGIVLFSMPGDSEGASLIVDGTAQLFVFTPLEIYPGDEVILVGYQGEFEGVIAMGVDGKAILRDVLSTDHALPVIPAPMLISEFNLIDMTNVMNWGQYVIITGYIWSYYDGYQEQLYLYLFEGLHAGESLEIMTQNETDLLMLAEYEGFEIAIKGFILPYFEEDFLTSDPIFFYSEYLDSVDVTYQTDLEKIDSIIQLGSDNLEYNAFYPGDFVDLPEAFPVLGATIVWNATVNPGGVLNLMTGLVSYTNIQAELTLEATITVGTTTVVHLFYIAVYPVVQYTIAEFYNLWYGDIGRIQGVVVAQVGNLGYLVADDSGMIMVEGFEGLSVGDSIDICGVKVDEDGMSRLQILDMNQFYIILDTGVTPNILESTMNLIEMTELEPYGYTPMLYTTIQGRLYYNIADSAAYITDGVHSVRIYPATAGAEVILASLYDSDVAIQVYLYDLIFDFKGESRLVIFVGELGELEAITLSDQEVADLLVIYAEDVLSQIYEDNSTYQFPQTHPIFGGTIGYELLGENAIYGLIVGNEINLYAPEVSVLIDVEVTATYGTVSLVVELQVALQVGDNPMGIALGSLGNVPVSLESTIIADMFSGFYVEEASRNNNFFGDGTEFVVDMWFPLPEDVGAQYYTLQYYDEILGWVNFDYDIYTPLTTIHDNFSLTLDHGYTFRLITTGVLGGELVSNSVEVPYTLIDTTFTGWSLDMGMWITGIMYPYVGCGMMADASVADLNDMTLDVELSYQWYRVNPFTYAETLIPGATNQLYVTTIEDAGYILKVKISGDEVTVGGFVQVFSFDPIQVFNPGFVSNVTTLGFVLNLGYAVPLMDIENNLFVYDQYGNELMISGVATTINPAIYVVTVDLTGVTDIDLQLYANTWSLGSMDAFGYSMPGIYYHLK